MNGDQEIPNEGFKGPTGFPINNQVRRAAYFRARLSGRKPHECEAEAVKAECDEICRQNGTIGSKVFRVIWGTAGIRVSVLIYEVRSLRKDKEPVRVISEPTVLHNDRDGDFDWDWLETMLVKTCKALKWNQT